MFRGILIGVILAVSIYALTYFAPPLGILADRFDGSLWRASANVSENCTRARMWTNLSRRHLPRGASAPGVIAELGQPSSRRKATLLFYRGHGAVDCIVYDFGKCGLLGRVEEAEICFNKSGRLATTRKVIVSGPGANPHRPLDEDAAAHP